MQAKQNCLRVVVLTLVCSLLCAAFANAAFFTRDVPVDAASAEQVFKAHLMRIEPIEIRYNPTLDSSVESAGTAPRQVRFACQRSLNPQPSLCYGPYQLRQAYGVNELIGQEHITGKGSSITIIDAYGSPNIRKDLQRFDATWGLPDPQLNIYTPYGIGGTDSAWISETSLDVEWAHVMAPGATINLLLAPDSNDDNIYKVLVYAVKHNLGDIISLSFGENESCVDAKLRAAEHSIFNEATRKGMTLLAATGDSGSAQLACDSSTFEKAVSFPADDPLVTAVGGTRLVADATTGRYIRETAWNESSTYNKATGGGYSKIYRQPGFQRGLVGQTSGRAVPDIALNASVNGGLIVFESHRPSTRPIINIMGGTSAAAPELAGLLADGVQMVHHRLGSINPLLYRLGKSANYPLAFNDITSGDNLLLSSGLNGYRAHPGWDAATGWGSPRKASVFLRMLLQSNAPSPITGIPTVPTAVAGIPTPRVAPPQPPYPVPTTSAPVAALSKKALGR